jgi:hypothetical protein
VPASLERVPELLSDLLQRQSLLGRKAAHGKPRKKDRAQTGQPGRSIGATSPSGGVPPS